MPMPTKVRQQQKVEVKQKKETKEETPADLEPDVFDEVEDAPNVRLMLLGDEDYDRDYVNTQIKDVVQGVDPRELQDVFQKAQDSGVGLIGIFPKEMAEYYSDILGKKTPIIYTEVEDEGD